jgi:arylsulfatase A-like enzyme
LAISLHFNAPHWPWEGPGDEAESKRLAGTALRDFDGGTQKTYQRMIEAMDAQIGRVLELLDANGLTENTIVIFTSDNGGERLSDTWPFTGKKHDLLEGGLRIPTVIAWPARIAPGRTSDQVAISMDWLPTLLAAAGTAPDPGYPPDRMNLLPALTGNAVAVDRKLFWRHKGKWPRAARTVSMRSCNGDRVVIDWDGLGDAEAATTRAWRRQPSEISCSTVAGTSGSRFTQ